MGVLRAFLHSMTAVSMIIFCIEQAPVKAENITGSPSGIPVPLVEREGDVSSIQKMPLYDWKDEDYQFFSSFMTAEYPTTAEYAAEFEGFTRQTDVRGSKGCVNRRCRCCCGPKFYVAPIIGPSFGTFTNESLPSSTESLFTAGGAVGIDLHPQHSGWRFDFEARYRDPIGNMTTVSGVPVSVRAEQLWSTLVNVYRDVALTNSMDLYFSGGIGAGGYQTHYTGSNTITNTDVVGGRDVGSFAWQLGTGVAWEISRRMTFDVGYRFFEIGGDTTQLTTLQSGVIQSTNNIASAFSASEVLFSLRVYEPFQKWW